MSLWWAIRFGGGADYLVAFWTMVMAIATIVLALGFPLSILETARRGRIEAQARHDRDTQQRQDEDRRKEERKTNQELRDEERRRVKQDRDDEQKREELRISRDFKIEERDKFYAQLDGIYLDIQKTIIRYPHLGKNNLQRDEDQLIQYDAFAFIIWNFIESIHDYCLDQDDLYDTWHCILQIEAKRYSDWFHNEENRQKFKKKFVDYICENV